MAAPPHGRAVFFRRLFAQDGNIGAREGFGAMTVGPACGYTDLPATCGSGGRMSSLKEFQCEICGITSDQPIHWFVIECSDQKLGVIKWDLAAANSPTARHFCGEAHAQVYISRWFDSICVPRKPLQKIS